VTIREDTAPPEAEHPLTETAAPNGGEKPERRPRPSRLRLKHPRLAASLDAPEPPAAAEPPAAQ